jgi:hypothetical protein
MTTILIAKDYFLVIMNTWDYKPYNHLGQVAKNNKSWLRIPKYLIGVWLH